MANDPVYRKARRILAYVSPENKAFFVKWSRGRSMGKTLNEILTDFFKRKK